MSAPTVKDLPKELLIADTLKGELLKEHNLKHTEAEEKNPLPTAEDLQQEKTHHSIITGTTQHNKQHNTTQHKQHKQTNKQTNIKLIISTSEQELKGLNVTH